jgi:hypothetical protein
VNATSFGPPTALFPAINAERFGPVRHVSRQGLAMLVSVTVRGAGFAMPAFARYRAPAAGAGTGRDAAPLGGSEHLADAEPGG